MNKNNKFIFIFLIYIHTHLCFFIFLFFIFLFFLGWAQLSPYGLGWAGPSQPGPATGPSLWPGWAKKHA
jgi:hypothetical protein